MKHRIQAVTLVELLIALVIFGVIVGLLGQILVSGTRAYNVNETVSEERQVIQTIEELLRYEVGLAGYRCTDGSSLTRTFASAPLDVASSGGVQVRYFEDRFTTGCDPVTVVLQSDGTDLVRDEGGTTSTMVSGVTSFDVGYWLSESNTQFVVQARPQDSELAGVGLVIGLADGTTHTVTVSLRNPQCAVLDDCL